MGLRKQMPLPWKWTILAIVAMLILSPFLLSGMVCLSVSDRMYDSDVIDETYDVILVLGCGIKANGEPSDMLADRLKTGIALYEDGVAPKVFLSGDNQSYDYNEIAVMKRVCLEAGVPEDAIVCDRYGLSTYDSIVRAVDIYGLRSAVIVTQKYHLYRALYIAEKNDMEAIGVDADLRAYRLQMYRNLREVLARCKDFYMTQRQIAPSHTEYGE